MVFLSDKLEYFKRPGPSVALLALAEKIAAKTALRMLSNSIFVGKVDVLVIGIYKTKITAGVPFQVPAVGVTHVNIQAG